MKLGQQLLGAHISPSQCNSTFHKPQEVDVSCSTRVVERKTSALGGYVPSMVQDHLLISKHSQKSGCNFGWTLILQCFFLHCKELSSTRYAVQCSLPCFVPFSTCQHRTDGPLEIQEESARQTIILREMFGARYGHVFWWQTCQCKGKGLANLMRIDNINMRSYRCLFNIVTLSACLQGWLHL